MWKPHTHEENTLMPKNKKSTKEVKKPKADKKLKKDKTVSL
ncbi:MAG: hypothetical protein ABIR91_04805 [Candidatus Saccharimonadales bacterium]